MLNTFRIRAAQKNVKSITKQRLQEALERLSNHGNQSELRINLKTTLSCNSIHLITGAEGNGQFCFPENLQRRSRAKYRDSREDTTVSQGTSDQVICFDRW